MSDTKVLAKGAAVALVGKVGGRFLHVTGQVVLARVLGPAAFGLYAIGWTILSMVGMLVPLGIDKGVIRYLPRAEGRPDLVKGILLQGQMLALASGVLATTVMWLLAPLLANSFFRKPEIAPVLRWFALLAIPIATLKVLASATRAGRELRYSVIAEDVGQPLLNLILVVLAFLAGWQLYGAVAALIMSFAMASLVSYRQLVRLHPQLRDPSVRPFFPGRELLLFSIPASAAGVFSNFTGRIDRLIVGRFMEPIDVGVYQAASQSSVLFAVILSAFSAIIAPMIADFHRRGDHRGLNETFVVSTKWAVYLSIPLLIVVLLAPADILGILFGPPYRAGALSLIILSVGQVANVGTGGVAWVLMMTGHPVQYLLVTVVALVGNGLLALFLVPRMGLSGAALSTAAAVAFMFLTSLFLVHRITRTWPYDRRYWKGLVASAVSAVVGTGTVAHFSPLGVAELIVTSLAVTVTFAGTLHLLGWEPEDRLVLHLIGRRLRRRPS